MLAPTVVSGGKSSPNMFRIIASFFLFYTFVTAQSGTSCPNAAYGALYTNTNGTDYNLYCNYDYQPTIDSVANVLTFEDCLLQCDSYSPPAGGLACGAVAWAPALGNTCYLKRSAADGGGLSGPTTNVYVGVKRVSALVYGPPIGACPLPDGNNTVYTDAQNHNYTVHCGQDTKGDNYYNASTPQLTDLYSTSAIGSYQECFYQCSLRGGCLGFTWIGRNGAENGTGTGQCYFKQQAVDCSPVIYSWYNDEVGVYNDTLVSGLRQDQDLLINNTCRASTTSAAPGATAPPTASICPVNDGTLYTDTGGQRYLIYCSDGVAGQIDIAYNIPSFDACLLECDNRGSVCGSAVYVSQSNTCYLKPTPEQGGTRNGVGADQVGVKYYDVTTTSYPTTTTTTTTSPPPAVVTPVVTTTSSPAAMVTSIVTTPSSSPSAVPECPVPDGTSFIDSLGQAYTFYCSAGWGGNLEVLPGLTSFDDCATACDVYSNANGVNTCGAVVWNSIVNTCYLKPGEGVNDGGIGGPQPGTDKVGVKVVFVSSTTDGPFSTTFTVTPAPATTTPVVPPISSTSVPVFSTTVTVTPVPSPSELSSSESSETSIATTSSPVIPFLSTTVTPPIIPSPAIPLFSTTVTSSAESTSSSALIQPPSTTDPVVATVLTTTSSSTQASSSTLPAGSPCPVVDGSIGPDSEGQEYTFYCSADWAGNIDTLPNVLTFDACLIACDNYPGSICGAVVWVQTSQTCYIEPDALSGGYLLPGTSQVAIRVVPGGIPSATLPVTPVVSPITSVPVSAVIPGPVTTSTPGLVYPPVNPGPATSSTPSLVSTPLYSSTQLPITPAVSPSPETSSVVPIVTNSALPSTPVVSPSNNIPSAPSIALPGSTSSPINPGSGTITSVPQSVSRSSPIVTSTLSPPTSVIPPISAAACAVGAVETQISPAGVVYAVQCSADTGGMLVQVVEAQNTYTECFNACDADPECQGFTYVGVAGSSNGVGPGNCYFKAINGAPGATVPLLPGQSNFVAAVVRPGGPATMSMSGTTSTTPASTVVPPQTSSQSPSIPVTPSATPPIYNSPGATPTTSVISSATVATIASSIPSGTPGSSIAPIVSSPGPIPSSPGGTLPTAASISASATTTAAGCAATGQQTFTSNSGDVYDIQCGSVVYDDGTYGKLDVMVTAYSQCFAFCDSAASCDAFFYTGAAGGIGPGYCILFLAQSSAAGSSPLTFELADSRMVAAIRRRAVVVVPTASTTTTTSPSPAASTCSSTAVSTIVSSAGNTYRTQCGARTSGATEYSEIAVMGGVQDCYMFCDANLACAAFTYQDAQQECVLIAAGALGASVLLVGGSPAGFFAAVKVAAPMSTVPASTVYVTPVPNPSVSGMPSGGGSGGVTGVSNGAGSSITAIPTYSGVTASGSLKSGCVRRTTVLAVTT